MRAPSIDLAWLRSNLNYLPLVVVVSFSLLYSLSFLNIYRQEHSYQQASRWVYQNVPPNSKLIGVHWDDRLPVGLPGFDPGIYENTLELPLYEPDSPLKTRQISERMSAGDYLIFPTQRIPGSLLRVPDEYPQTASFLRQLYAGQLGYQLVKTIKIEPSLGLFSFDDDLADESFSVYDHPKVAIFKNVGRLSSPQITERIYASPKAGILPSLAEVMQRYSNEQPASSYRSAPLAQFILWFVVLELLFLASLPILACLIPEARDRGAGLAPVFGLLILGYISWLLGSLQLVAPGAGSLWIILFCYCLLSAFVVWQVWGSWRDFAASFGKQVLHVQIVFLAMALLFMLIRALNPAVYWGEKPMDFTFLNFFARNDALPPQDPWSAGNQMRYYYFGSYLMGALSRMTGPYTGLTYNLSMVTVAAAMFTSAYSIFSWISAKRWVVVLLSSALVLLSNIEVLYLAMQGKNLDFHLFWASSRLFTSPSITEYPLWSLLFADLHAHLISLPFCLTLVGLGIALFFDNSPLNTVRYWGLRFFYGLAWGVLFILNSWDFISFALISAVLLGAKHLRELNFSDGVSILKALCALLLEGSICALTAVVCVSPFWFDTIGGLEAGQGWVQSMEFNTLTQVLRHLAHWYIPLIFGLALVLLGDRKRSLAQLNNIPWLSLSILVTLTPLFLGALSFFHEVRLQPWGILALCSICLALCCACFNHPDLNRGERFSIICATSASLLIPFAELRFLNDHMNTIFKFYNQIWLLLGISALAFLPRLISSILHSSASALSRWGKRVALALPCLLLIAASIGSVINIVIMINHEYIRTPRPTLDGVAYLKLQDPDQAAGIEWINSSISGTPVLLEAQGDSYQNYTRISMNTGLPTVLGWDHHVKQRGTDPQDVEKRRIDIRNIYSTQDIGLAYNLLRRYNVQLIVVGRLESESYSKQGLDKFSAHPELFPVLFEHGSFKIFSTTYAASVFKPRGIS